MNRALALLAVAWLVVLAAIFARAAIDPDPVPFAAEDENGTVYLWPGALERPGEPSPAAPDMLFVPCPLGPRNVPSRPENKA